MPASAPHAVASLVVPLASRSTNSDSGGSNLIGGPGRPESVNKLVVTAVGGGTLTLKIDHSKDGSSWSTLDTFPAQSTTTTGITRVIADEGKNPYLRYSWTISGGSVTFSVQTAMTPALMLAG